MKPIFMLPDGSFAVRHAVTRGTYAEIKALRDDSALTPGGMYEMTDYETVYTQPVSLEVRSDSSNLFNVLLLAVDTNRFAPEAWAAPTDRAQPAGSVLTAATPLDRWRLLYDIDNDTTKYEWAVPTGKGVIYRLIDHSNNDLPYDFYNVKFRRYLITATTTPATALVNKYLSPEKTKAGFTIDVNDYDDLLTLKLNLVVRQNRVEPHYVSTKQRALNNNTFGGNCSYNTFVGSCRNNTFGKYCNYNTFGGYCYNNTFGGDCNYNTFGDHCYNNTFGGGNVLQCNFAPHISGKNFSIVDMYGKTYIQTIFTNAAGTVVVTWLDASNVQQFINVP